MPLCDPTALVATLLPAKCHGTCRLEDAHYGVGALLLLGGKDELQTEALCSLAAAKLSSANATVTEAWQAADIAASCR